MQVVPCCQLNTDLFLSEMQSLFDVIEGLIKNLEEEAKMNKYMVGEVHPKEITALKKVIQNVQKIVMEPALGQSDLDAIHQEVVTLPYYRVNVYPPVSFV